MKQKRRTPADDRHVIGALIVAEVEANPHSTVLELVARVRAKAGQAGLHCDDHPWLSRVIADVLAACRANLAGVL